MRVPADPSSTSASMALVASTSSIMLNDFVSYAGHLQVLAVVRAWHSINNSVELDRAEALRDRTGREKFRRYSTIPILLADRSLR
jgi:hypothetical protein